MSKEGVSCVCMTIIIIGKIVSRMTLCMWNVWIVCHLFHVLVEENFKIVHFKWHVHITMSKWKIYNRKCIAKVNLKRKAETMSGHISLKSFSWRNQKIWQSKRTAYICNDGGNPSEEEKKNWSYLTKFGDCKHRIIRRYGKCNFH